jgi:predicted glycosyltransferase
MKILIDIGHPAHVHFFRHAISRLLGEGHEVLITSRDKEIAIQLLDGLCLPHKPLSRMGGGGIVALGKELLQRNWALFKEVRRFKPDVMAAIGGIFIAQVGFLTRTPSLVFYDTENATLQNALTYPFASLVLVPRCYGAWLPEKRHVRYPGYHELAYLHPDYFTPDRTIAEANGLAQEGDTFFVRVVSWQANHDLAERGWSPALLKRLVAKLAEQGKVLISAEGELDAELAPYCYDGDVNQVHHVLAFCRAFVGESATMASECAVLGTPAVYAANTGRGYTDEQEARYGLVRNVFQLEWELIADALDQLLSQPREHWSEARQQLLADTLDVTDFIVQSLLTFPRMLTDYQNRQG